ncbi:hypothetical protein D3C76_1819010 [compost metagenome]
MIHPWWLLNLDNLQLTPFGIFGILQNTKILLCNLKILVLRILTDLNNDFTWSSEASDIIHMTIGFITT